MKRTIYLWTLLATTAAVMASCNYFPDDIEEQLVAISSYDTSTNFRSYQTFAIADSVGVIQMSAQGKPYVVYERTEIDQQVIAAVTDQLVNYCGYQQLSKPYDPETPPDLIVDLYYTKVTNVSVYYSDWWWYWYDYGWYPPYYPYYPDVVTSYSVGTLYIDMKDMSNAKGKVAEQRPVPVQGIWVGAVRGLYTGMHTMPDIKSGISDCFVQTPGMKK